ncbi:hypothetical protein ACRAWF_13315 [Streptomyces sp. L7]
MIGGEDALALMVGYAEDRRNPVIEATHRGMGVLRRGRLRRAGTRRAAAGGTPREASRTPSSGAQRLG